MHSLSLIVVAAILVVSGIGSVAASEPASIGVGDEVVLTLEATTGSATCRLRIVRAEPLTIAAECFDADVRLVVEDESGVTLGQDDDSGVESNPWLVWSPIRAESVVVRVTASSAAAGTVKVFSLRGRGDPAVAEPDRAVLDYWEKSYDSGRRSGDSARTGAALAALSRLEGGLGARDVEMRLVARLAVVDSARALAAEADAAAEGGRLDLARDRVRSAFDLLAEAEDPVSIYEAYGLSRRAMALGDAPTAAAALTRVERAWRRSHPSAHPSRLSARANLAAALSRWGDFAAAKSLEESVLSVREAVLPETHDELARARESLAFTLSQMGELRAALSLQERVLAARLSTLPEDDVAVQRARSNLGAYLFRLGEFEASRPHLESALAIYEKKLAKDDRALQASRANVGHLRMSLGDLEGARSLFEAALESLERTMPEGHVEIQLARDNLGNVFMSLGRWPEAAALFEAALAALETRVAEDHPVRLTVESNLGSALRLMGRLPESLFHLDRVVAIRERIALADDPELPAFQASLASTLTGIGDHVGARALLERAIASAEGFLSRDHPTVLMLRSNLGATLVGMGDRRAARAIEEEILAVRERTRPENHPDIQLARSNLAVTLRTLGEYAEARALQENVLAVQEKTLPPDHPDVLRGRHELADTLRFMGELEASRSLFETCLAGQSRVLPDDDPNLQLVRAKLLVVSAALKDRNRAATLASDLSRGARGRMETAIAATSSRQAMAMAAATQPHLSAALSFGSGTGSDDALAKALFGWCETRRALAECRRPDEAALGAGASGPRADLLAARRRVADVVAGLGSTASDERPSAAIVADAVRERDRAEAEYRKAIGETGLSLAGIDSAPLAAALSARSAAVAYLRYSRLSFAEGERHGVLTVESYLAHVVRPDGTLRRVELGAASAIEEAALRWRREIGSPIVRGATVESGVAGASSAPGEALRALVLDPVLKEVGDATTLFVCADDVLHLTPLDALPLDARTIVGDRYSIRSETSFARLVAVSRGAANRREAGAKMLVMGGIDFDAAGASNDLLAGSGSRLVAAAPRSAVATDRSGPGGLAFIPLRETKYEADAIADLFEKTLAAEPLLLKGEGATKSAFHDAAPLVRYLHLATHGYFASESVKSVADPTVERAPSPGLLTLEEAVTGLSPMALCGLALAGANRGMDSLGRVPGILTAEELSGVDLSSCELAVLSACETNVGLRRAGQGIASLQAALHVAGARTAITSLWKVDDERTRELMVDFYRRIWVEKKGKALALWEAKKALRAKGAPVRDWAGWVLTGDPD